MKDFKSSNRFMKVDRFGDINYDYFSVGFGIIDMSTEQADYNISSTGVEAQYLPQFAYIIPETAGAIVVELYGMNEGDTYTISAAQVTAFTGKPMPYKIRKVVKSGTTATFSMVW